MTQPMHPGHVAQTTANIARAFQMLEEAIADPDVLDGIPLGAVVVSMPHDDPSLASLNLALANKLTADGEHVWLQRVGVPAPDSSQWHLPAQQDQAPQTLHLRWASSPPPDAKDLVITYDRSSDTMVVDLFARRRPGVDVPVNDSLSLLVDLETEEVIGHLVPHFLEQAMQKAPHILSLLLATNAHLTGITRDEVIALRNHGMDGVPTTTTPQPTAAAILEELALLSV